MRRIGALLYQRTRLPILRSPTLLTRLPSSLVAPHPFTSRVVLWHGATRHFSSDAWWLPESGKAGEGHDGARDGEGGS
jgi:hypothetical protein